MIKKVVKIQSLQNHNANSIKDDLAYWLQKSPQERLDAVELLRRQFHGNTTRLQRSAQVIKRP
jgi:hypothetical protein